MSKITERMNNPNRKKVLFYDEKGAAVGIGEEWEVIERTNTPGFVVIQTIQTGSGAYAENIVDIDDMTYQAIKDPHNKISLKDFIVNKGSVKIRKK